MDGVGITRTFANESRLAEWFEVRKADCGSRNAFVEWLSLYYREGNKIEVSGKTYSYLECLKFVA